MNANFSIEVREVELWVHSVKPKRRLMLVAEGYIQGDTMFRMELLLTEAESAIVAAAPEGQKETALPALHDQMTRAFVAAFARYVQVPMTEPS